MQLIDRACVFFFFSPLKVMAVLTQKKAFMHAQYRHIHKRCIYCEMLEAPVVSLSLWRSVMVMQRYIAVRLVWSTESVIQYDC